jgi:uncharacterized repeat protein (TIGR03803 family)
MRFSHIIAVLFALAFLLPVSAFGAKHSTLHSFTGGTDGATPVGGVAFDSGGNLYGITNSGGNQECVSSLSTGCGTVFELMPGKKGAWNESVIHVFSQASDGGNPAASLILDASGNLYGTTQYYGPFSNGVLWQLAPSSGNWNENILHPFHGGRDGFWCFGLTIDSHGGLFGTTYAGGPQDDGLVFRLEPQSNGKWKDIILHDFSGGNNDGSSPSDAVTFANGKLYGTTYEGGPHLTGTVFEMQHTSGGWTENPIYIFQGLPFGKNSDGTNPTAGVIFDGAGNLYGTTDYGGSAGVGTVYQLAPDGKGGWTETILHVFTDGKDGGHPNGLIMDSAGNLYGTTSGHNTFGSVFELSPSGGGKWKFTVLYDFKGGKDGASASGALVRDLKGNLYGTTAFGGTDNLGVVFEITP